MLGRKPRRIDIPTSISGVTFAAASKGAVVIAIGRKKARVIGQKALVANKRASGRVKDLLDLEPLKARRRRVTQ